MQQHRDPRYRGRGRRTAAPPKRKPGHLRTNYTDNDAINLFIEDMEKVRSVWPEEVREGDRRAVMKVELRSAGIVLAVFMVPITVMVAWMVIDKGLPWWIVPVAQTLVLLFIGLKILIEKRKYMDEDIDILIRREADRRGIKYDKHTPLSTLMNRINADYNSRLWNRNFNWK